MYLVNGKNNNKLGQHQSQTPFSSAFGSNNIGGRNTFWIKMVQKYFDPRRFREKKNWVQNNLGQTNFCFTFFSSNKFWVQRKMETSFRHPQDTHSMDTKLTCRVIRSGKSCVWVSFLLPLVSGRKQSQLLTPTLTY